MIVWGLRACGGVRRCGGHPERFGVDWFSLFFELVSPQSFTKWIGAEGSAVCTFMSLPVVDIY